jgi:hypothetical protein
MHVTRLLLAAMVLLALVTTLVLVAGCPSVTPPDNTTANIPVGVPPHAKAKVPPANAATANAVTPANAMPAVPGATANALPGAPGKAATKGAPAATPPAGKTPPPPPPPA